TRATRSSAPRPTSASTCRCASATSSAPGSRTTSRSGSSASTSWRGSARPTRRGRAVARARPSCTCWRPCSAPSTAAVRPSGSTPTTPAGGRRCWSPPASGSFQQVPASKSPKGLVLAPGPLQAWPADIQPTRSYNYIRSKGGPFDEGTWGKDGSRPRPPSTVGGGDVETAERGGSRGRREGVRRRAGGGGGRGVPAGRPDRRRDRGGRGRGRVRAPRAGCASGAEVGRHGRRGDPGVGRDGVRRRCLDLLREDGRARGSDVGRPAGVPPLDLRLDGRPVPGTAGGLDRARGEEGCRGRADAP